MIISASRRTDIPALYSDWLLHRLREGYALVPNPRHPGRLGRVDLSPHCVDCIVFWTKNPLPLLGKLATIEKMGHRFLFHFTLTPYDKSIEKNLPPKARLIQAFTQLARQTSPEQVIWRYDPVLINNRCTLPWHMQCFASLCKVLHQHTRRCILSFVDAYKSMTHAFRPLNFEEMAAIAEGFAAIAKTFGLTLSTCAEHCDLAAYGVPHGACIDHKELSRIVGACLSIKQDNNQRVHCLCAQAVDIGAYNTCTHGCTYCYAVSNPGEAAHHKSQHLPHAPMLTGYPTGKELVTDRTIPSHKPDQFSLL